MNEEIKSKVFISHSSNDKHFVTKLADFLRRSKVDVWFDKWEIAIGDSIVEKVFDGLKASDILVIVLSKSSIASRWVKEELNTTVMRRISENDIRILPVLIEDCEIPTPLNHIRYADFRELREENFFQLLEAITPGYFIWESLALHYEHFCLLSDQLMKLELDADADEKIIKIHSLLESSLNLRTELELRKKQQKAQDLSFFEKIGLLAEKGIDIRNDAWNSLVNYRSGIAHNMGMYGGHLRSFIFVMKNKGELKKSDNDELRKILEKNLSQLKVIMRLICFDKWNSRNMDTISKLNRYS